MRFLFPGFLFTLSAVAIPVIIHLFNFRKFKKVYFSNVRFLKDIDQQTSSSRKLKNWLLLAVRILAIVFLVLAFAKPYIPGHNQRLATQNQLVSIYIDNSYSMETLNREGTLLDEAKRRAKEIASAYGVNDRFQLITNDFEGKHQRLLAAEEFANAVDEVKISASQRSLTAIINRQQEIFTSEPNALKSVYIVSDFQKNIVDQQSTKIDSVIKLRFLKLKANSQPNVSVDSVWFISPVHKPGGTENLVIQLRNNSDKRADNIPYKLTINYQQKSIGSLTVEARSVKSDTLSISGLNAGWKTGKISITDYPIVFDDHFFFTFYVEQQLHVLAINDVQVNPYLKAVYQADPFFKLDNVPVGAINYSGLSTYPLVILNSVTSISSALAQQLKTYVQQGGNLMVFPALSEDISGLKVLTQIMDTDQPEELITQPEKVTSINLQHPLFKGVFEQLPRNPDLPLAKKYIRYSNTSRISKQNILEFASGRSFLSQYKSGKGKIYLSAVPLDEEASNFVRHSVFVPFMYQSAFLSSRDNRLFYTIGKDQYLESAKITLPPNQTLRLKKGSFEAIPDIRQGETSTRIFIADQIKEQGVYSLLKADSVLANYAFNNSRTESNLSYASENDLQAKYSDQKVEIFNPGKESVKETIKAVNKGVQLWKLCLILALISLAAEILIIRFYKQAKQVKI